MREVQATEAKTHLAELWRAVEHGETVLIKRHGKPVARLVPDPEYQRANRERAVEQFKQRRAKWRRTGISTEDILEMRHAGHRW